MTECITVTAFMTADGIITGNNNYITVNLLSLQGKCKCWITFQQ